MIEDPRKTWLATIPLVFIVFAGFLVAIWTDDGRFAATAGLFVIPAVLSCFWTAFSYDEETEESKERRKKRLDKRKTV